jgi:hypothetical protein
MAKKTPWAILLCKFRDDPNLPGQTRIRDLFTQWETEHGAFWISQNVPPSAATDNRTILQLYNMFFTNQGAGTFNAVKYWDEMSHKNIDTRGTQIFPCTLNMTKAEGAALAVSPGGAAYQDAIFKKAKTALLNQHNVNWKNFYAVAVSFQSPDFGAQGGWYDGGPGVYMDIRYVMGNGTEAWGQEMGHAYGLDHSRQDGINGDYLDRWDVMSTANANYSRDNNYGLKGPGLNAWNMRCRTWLDETRVWKMQQGFNFDQKVELRPLHRHDLAGSLVAELPPNNGTGGHPRYLVELRLKQAWDEGIPRSAILVHRFEGNIGQFLGTHSYIMHGTKGQLDLAAGDVFISHDGVKQYSRVEVINIDDAHNRAIVRLSVFGNVQRLASSSTAHDDLHICAIDQHGGLWHTMRLANGNWPYPFGDIQQQTRLIGPNPGIGPTPKVACSVNNQGELHICAIDSNGGLWHTMRSANGTWPHAFGDVQHETRKIGPNGGIGTTPNVACATNHNGDLHICAIDRNGGLWHTIRLANGTWPYAFGDVQHETRKIGPNGGIGPTPIVACAINQNGDLHICAIDRNGGLWHTLRLANGTWPYAFGDVQHETRKIGPNAGIGPITEVTCTVNQNGDLQISVVDQNKNLWHTIRLANGNWPYAFGPVLSAIQ